MSKFIDMTDEKPVIIIEEKPDEIPGQGQSEVPVITIERDPAGDKDSDNSPRKKPHRLWVWTLGCILVTGLLCVGIWSGWRYYRAYNYLGVPIAVTPEENIGKLQAIKADDVTPEVAMTSDSVLGVAMNFYEARGLRAEISMTEPDTTDTDVFLYSRCADYHPDFSIIGSMVIDGKEIETARSNRVGYFAGVGDNYVIGISRSEKVKDYATQNGGCFFRQFILLSAGTLPPHFYLHGKVERRAIGRMGNDRLYYIETLHKETMWDFADALREYGFIDAIYITGGKDYCYYRTADGSRHDIGDVRRFPHKNAGQVPWVIFRKK